MDYDRPVRGASAMKQQQKIPLFLSLQKAIDKQIDTASQLNGKALPCQIIAIAGSIVTVEFLLSTDYTLPQVTMSVAGSKYITVPYQVGDKGVAIPADALLSGVSGLGAEVTSLDSIPSNLGALLFVPLGNVSIPANPMQVVITGPHGVVLSNEVGDSIITIADGSILLQNGTSVTMQVGTNSIVVSASGVAITGILTVNGHPYALHTHVGVQTGTDNSGVVTPGT